MCSAVRRRMLSNGTTSSPTPGATRAGAGARRRGAGAAGAGAGAVGAGAVRGRRRLPVACRGEHVVARDAPAFARAADRRGIEPVLGDQPAHDRRRDDARRCRGAALGRGRGRAVGPSLRQTAPWSDSPERGAAGAAGASRDSAGGRRWRAGAVRGSGACRRLGRGCRRGCGAARRRRRSPRGGRRLRRSRLRARGSRTRRPRSARAPRSRPCRSRPRTAVRRRRCARRPA